MKKIVLATATAAVLLSACSQNEVFENQGQDNAIAFGTYAALSPKASNLIEGNVFPDGGEMGVFAYYTGNTAWDGTASPNFMYDQMVAKKGAAYTYTPVKYWPNNANDKITFFAYYPYGAKGLSWQDHATPAAEAYTNSSVDLPVALFEVRAAAKDQVDFMVATVKDKTKPEGNAPVQFTFKHALTQVNFKAKLAAELVKDDNGTASHTTVTITGLKLKNIYKSAAMDMAQAAPTWTAHSNPADFTAVLSDANGVAIAGTTAQTITADTETFLMMPQTLQNTAAIEVTYKVKTVDAALNGGYSEITNTKETLISGAWASNGNVLYTLTIGLDQVNVSADVTEWDAQKNN